MEKSREEIEDCFLKCSTETKQSFMTALQMIYDEVFEINPYDDYAYILNSSYDLKVSGITICYSSFFWEYVDAMVYSHDCEEFIANFQPKALRKFIELEKTFIKKKYVRLRTDTKNKEWYIATLIKNPLDKRRVILLMKNEDEVCTNEMQKKAIMEDYDYVVGITVQNEKISVYSCNMPEDESPTFFNIFYKDFLEYRIKKYVVKDMVEKTFKKMNLKNIISHLKNREAYTCYTTMKLRKRIFHKKFRFVYLDDKKETIIMSQMDVTEQIEKEQKKNDAIKLAVQEARRANESKSNFLSRMSHDMRTPLNAIVGMDMIAASHIDDKNVVMESLNSILCSSKNLLELVDDVLDVNNFERGRLAFYDMVFSWSCEIENIMQMIRPLADRKKHKVEADFSGITNDIVIGDSKRVRQICTNLLSNAVKYTPDGGRIYFSIEEKGAFKEKDDADTVYMEYELIVEDNGIGISEEFIPHLFEPFERDKKVLCENISGTGLGMTIARNLARLMGGDIYVKSNENEGTKFNVTFKLKLPDQDSDSILDNNNMSGGVIKF